MNISEEKFNHLINDNTDHDDHDNYTWSAEQIFSQAVIKTGIFGDYLEKVNEFCRIHCISDYLRKETLKIGKQELQQAKIRLKEKIRTIT